MKPAIRFLLALSVPAVFVPGWCAAGTPINETRPLAAEARVDIENRKGRIEVSGWDKAEARIEGTLGDEAKLAVTGEGAHLNVRVEYPSGSGGWFGGLDGGEPSTLKIQLPRGVALNIDSVSAAIGLRDVQPRSLNLDSVSGDIAVTDSSPLVDINAVSGDLKLQLDSPRVALETVSGDIDARGKLAGRLEVETVSGDVKLETEMLNDGEISTVSGNIGLHSRLGANARLQIEALSGDVTLGLPAATSARVTASSFSGAIDAPIGTVKKEKYGPGSSLEAQLGSGNGEIRLETFSGDIRLKTE